MQIKEFINGLNIKDYIYITIIVVLSLVYLKNCHNSLPKGTQLIQPALEQVEKKTDIKGREYSQIVGTLYTPEQMKLITDSIAKTLKAKAGLIFVTLVT